jgi:hypothetical protein
MIIGALKVLFLADSEDAACHIIETAQYMNASHCRQIADYLDGLAADKEHRASEGEKA